MQSLRWGEKDGKQATVGPGAAPWGGVQNQAKGNLGECVFNEAWHKANLDPEVEARNKPFWPLT